MCECERLEPIRICPTRISKQKATLMITRMMEDALGYDHADDEITVVPSKPFVEIIRYSVFSICFITAWEGLQYIILYERTRNKKGRQSRYSKQ